MCDRVFNFVNTVVSKNIIETEIIKARILMWISRPELRFENIQVCLRNRQKKTKNYYYRSLGDCLYQACLKIRDVNTCLARTPNVVNACKVLIHELCVNIEQLQDSNMFIFVEY